MKSPPQKIQSQELTLIDIEPLITPEPKSVPPPSSGVLATVSNAVLPLDCPMAPKVQDATTMAASLSAWTGDPSPLAPILQPDVYDNEVYYDAMLIPPSYSGPPDLDIPLELEIPTAPVEVFNVIRDHYPCQHSSVYTIRDDHQCFQDVEYSKLPRKGPLYTFFYSTLVYLPTRPLIQRRPAQPVPVKVNPPPFLVLKPPNVPAVSDLPAWGGGWRLRP